MKIPSFIFFILLMFSCDINKPEDLKSLSDEVKTRGIRPTKPREHFIGIQVKEDGNFDFRKEAYDFSEYYEAKIIRGRYNPSLRRENEDDESYNSKRIDSFGFFILGGESLNFHPFLNDGGMKGFFFYLGRYVLLKEKKELKIEDFENIFLNGGDYVFNDDRYRYSSEFRENGFKVIKNENEKDYVFIVPKDERQKNTSISINIKYLKEIFEKEKSKKSLCIVGSGDMKAEYYCDKEEDKLLREHLKEVWLEETKKMCGDKNNPNLKLEHIKSLCEKDLYTVSRKLYD